MGSYRTIQNVAKERLSETQREMLERLKKAKYDFISLYGSASFQTGRSLVYKDLAEFISGLGSWGRYISITDKGKEALK